MAEIHAVRQLLEDLRLLVSLILVFSVKHLNIQFYYYKLIANDAF